MTKNRSLRTFLGIGASLALAVAALFGAASLQPTTGNWTPSEITSNPYQSQPALAIDGSGKTSVAYERLGADPGIFLASDSTGSWVSERISTGSDQSPALAIDSGGKRHVVFAHFGGSPGLYYTTDISGSWSTPARLTTFEATSPTIAIDSGGHVRIIVVSLGFSRGLYYLSNVAGGFGSPLRVTSGHLDYRPSMVLDASDKVHVAWTRFAPEAPGLYYTTNKTGSWVSTRLTTYYASRPAMLFDGSGKAHIAYERWYSNYTGLSLMTNATGSWVESQLWNESAYDVGAPTIAMDLGTVYVAAARWPKFSGLSGGGLTIYFTGGIYQLPDDPEQVDSDWPSMEFDASHHLHLAFVRSLPTPGLAYYEADAATLQTAIDSRTLDGSVVDEVPNLALDSGGDQHVAFERHSTDTDNGINAGDDNGGWSFETAAGTPAEPSIVVDSSGHEHIAYSDGADVHYVTNATGSWVDTTIAAGMHPSLAIEADDHLTIAFAGDPYLAVARNGTGSWVVESLTGNGYPNDPRISVGVDSSGHTHIAVSSFSTGTNVRYLNDVSGSWVNGLAATTGYAADLSVDAANHIHIAYVRYDGINSGTWYRTNKSGSWIVLRLTRTSAEGPPSLGVDAAAHAYIATGRYYWAANPGIYLVTNRTGSWVTSRVTAAYDTNPSVAVTGPGYARIVFENETLGISDLVQIDPLGNVVTLQSSSASARALAGMPRIADRVRSAGGEPVAADGHSLDGSSPPSAGQTRQGSAAQQFGSAP
jgi:hypothetical protein